MVILWQGGMEWFTALSDRRASAFARPLRKFVMPGDEVGCYHVYHRCVRGGFLLAAGGGQRAERPAQGQDSIEMADLLEGRYADCERVIVVCDQSTNPRGRISEEAIVLGAFTAYEDIAEFAPALTVTGKVLRRKRLEEIGTLFTPDTILRWHRLLVAKKWDYSSALGHVGHSRSVDVTDSETLSVTIGPAAISENGERRRER